MSEFLLVISAGLAAGVTHVYVGVDHLAALMPLSVGRQRNAAWLGVRWGIGHSLGVLAVAILLLTLRETLSKSLLDSIGTWGERAVGVMLIGLGFWCLRSTLRQKLHIHEHEHDGEVHSHLHLHSKQGHGAHEEGRSHVHKHAAVAAGTLHGAAGMAHLMGVLPSLALPSLGQSLLYLGAFALGSILAMAVFAAAFGTLTAKLGNRAPKLVKGSMYASALVCVLVGAAWIGAPLLGYELP